MCSRTATGRCSTWSGRVRRSGGNRNPWLCCSRGRLSGGAQEFGVEHLHDRHLAAPVKSNLVRAIIRKALVGLRGDGGTSHDQSRDEGAKESFASASGV